MKKRLFLTIFLMIALTTVLAACGGGNTNTATNNGDGEDPQSISFLTGGASGTYYPQGGVIAKIITDETGIQREVQSSNASTDNIIAQKDGEAEMAFTQTDVTSDAVNGTNAFEGEAVDTVLAVGSLYPETVQIVTTDKSGIES